MSSLSHPEFTRWRTAIFAIFLASGLSIATWASRVPSIKQSLAIENTQVGALLFGAGIASILGISLAPPVLARFGPRRGMLAAIITFAVGIALIGIGTDALGSYPLVLTGLALFGVGNGSVDVMMNVEAADIEKRGGRTILPLFHAFFSLGNMIGAGAGVLATALGLNVLIHAVAIGAVLLALAPIATSSVPKRLTGEAEQTSSAKPASSRAQAEAETSAGRARRTRERIARLLSAWREPRTYALGLILLGMAFAEGAANDWLALGIAEDHGAGEAMGAVGLSAFFLCMTTMRVLGSKLVDRFGRVPVLRVLAAAATAGILLYILAPTVPLVIVGAALWGVGASMGFPLGIAAAADDPERAASRVSAVATIGYVATLAGPPLLGIISDGIGLLNTLFIIAGLAVVSGIAATAARPLTSQRR